MNKLCWMSIAVVVVLVYGAMLLGASHAADAYSRVSVPVDGVVFEDAHGPLMRLHRIGSGETLMQLYGPGGQVAISLLAADLDKLSFISVDGGVMGADGRFSTTGCITMVSDSGVCRLTIMQDGEIAARIP